MFKNELFNELLEIISENTNYDNIDLNVNVNSFELTINNYKKISINKHGFLFEIKEDKYGINKSVIRVTPHSINLYNKKYSEDNSKYSSFGIKIDKDYDYMKLSKNIKTDKIYKTDTELEMDNNRPIIITKKRIYNKDGFLVQSSITEEDLLIEKEEYVKSVLKENNNDLEYLYNQVEEMIPGITDYIVNINNNYDFMKSNTNKKLIK